MKEVGEAGPVYRQCMALMVRLAQLGLVHCDFNEFNLLARPPLSLRLSGTLKPPSPGCIAVRFTSPPHQAVSWHTITTAVL